MISATNLTMRYGSKILFKNAHFQLNPGQHYGLIGATSPAPNNSLKVRASERRRTH